MRKGTMREGRVGGGGGVEGQSGEEYVPWCEM